jgi:hypothetical protein
MSTINLSLATTFLKVFGIEPLPYDIKDFPEIPENSLTGIKEGMRRESGIAAGTPYYSRGLNGREYYMPVWVEYQPEGQTTATKLELPYPVVSADCDKRMVETQMTERKGAVIELINANNWRIRIRGLIINSNNEHPEELITQLVALFEQDAAVVIKSAYTDTLLFRKERQALDKVVIKSLRFPEVTGVKHVIPYDMELVSDSLFSLEEVGNV